MKKKVYKIVGLFLIVIATSLFAQVGRIGESNEVARVAVSNDGKLHAWNKYGEEIQNWPKDLSGENHFFAYRPRLVDLDFDLQDEIIAVSEDKNNARLRLHVFKGNGTEESNWRWDIPNTDIAETPFIADLNHDSSLDIAYSTKGNRVFVYRRDFEKLDSFTAQFDATPYLAVGDPDNNGLQNLFAAVGTDLLTWDEQGPFSHFFTLPSGEEMIGGLTILDINKDNYSEILFSTTKNRIVVLDKSGHVFRTIKAPEGDEIISPLLAEDIDVDREPELMVLTRDKKILAFETNGAKVTGWDVSLSFGQGTPAGGIIANDLYRGLFATSAGWDQTNIYRTKFGTYSRIQLGESVHEWDARADFQFVEAVEITDVLAFPKLFTPNEDEVNDVTQIHYKTSKDAHIAFDLYDAHERFISRMRTKEFRNAGEHQEEFKGVDTKGTLTAKDDAPLDTGLYILKVVAESEEGFVTTAKVSVVVNGIKAEIESPEEAASVFGKVVISGIATDPNFGENNLDADFQSYKLYVRPGAWNLSAEEVVEVGKQGSSWRPLEVPLRHQCSDNRYREPNDSYFLASNVSCRPVQHGELGWFDSSDPITTPNGDYTILLKVMDSAGNTVGKVNYDTLVVNVANPNTGDPFDADNPFDPLNPNNPKYLGPKITNTTLSNASITRQNDSTNIAYTLENETSHIHISIFPFDNGQYGSPISIYSFNYRAPARYTFTWDGKNTLGRNVAGGHYKIQISAQAIDGTGFDRNESLELDVVRGFSASDILSVESFSATPDHINPLGFGADLAPEKATISFNLTKDAKVTLQIYDGNPEEGAPLVRTLLREQITDNGYLLWDGSGDNGLILPVGKSYTARLIAEGIDMGNDETVHQEIQVTLDNISNINLGLAADITELRGEQGEVMPDDDELRSMVGNSDFLWRAGGSGSMDVPFTWNIGAIGTNSYWGDWVETNGAWTQTWVCNLMQRCQSSPIASLTIPSGHRLMAFGGIHSGPIPATYTSGDSNWRRGLLYEGFSFYRFDTGARMYSTWGEDSRLFVRDGDFFVNRDGTYNHGCHAETFPLGNPASNWCNTDRTSYSNLYVPANEAPTTIRATGQGSGNNFPTVCRNLGNGYGGNPGSLVTHCFDFRLLAWTQGRATCQSGISTQGQYIYLGDREDRIRSGDGTLRLSATYDQNLLSTCPGVTVQNNVGQQLTVEEFERVSTDSYSLRVSATINSQSISREQQSGTLSLPGFIAWLGNSGEAYASVDSAFASGYRTVDHDPYTNGHPYNKIWGWVRDFNRDEYRQKTDPINIYYDGYRPNIFSGDPGTNLYAFSNVVHINSWDINLRYPNISVDQPDGEDLIALGIFALEGPNVTAPGTRGAVNSNVEDNFRLRLLPEAVGKRFVEIKGSAGTNYELFYYDNDEVDPKWSRIAPRTHNLVANGILAHWDVTHLNGENYTLVVRTKDGNGNLNQDTFNIGIGERVDVSSLSSGEFQRVYTTFKRASVIFGPDSLSQPELITITPVKRSDADYQLPAGVAPLGPIFDIKPDNIEIDPRYHVQLEITYTPEEIRDVFGVADTSELQIYNLAGDEELEGLATVITLDDMDDDDPTNDVYRFTANLEHFSQYMLARKQAGYFYVTSPTSDAFLKGMVNITGRVEQSSRSVDNKETPGVLSNLTRLKISYYADGDANNKTTIYDQTVTSPDTSLSVFSLDWDISGINGNYILYFEAEGPQGAKSSHTLPVAIDNLPSQSTLLINGQAVADGTTVTVASGAIVEIKSNDSASEKWQSGVTRVEYSLDGSPFADYTQPFALNYMDGEHIILYRAIDANENLEADKSATVHVQELLDRQPEGGVQMNLRFNGPSFVQNNQTWVSGQTQFVLSIADDNYDQIKYRISDSEYIFYRDPFTIGALNEGPYILEYFVVDLFGLRSDLQTKQLLLDITAPETLLETTGDALRSGGDLFITPETQIILKAVDGGEQAVGLSRIEYRLDEGDWQVYREPIRVNSTKNLYYRSVDRLENVETEHQVRLRLDDVAPVLQTRSFPTAISPNNDGRLDTADFVIFISDNFAKKLFATVILSGEVEATIFDHKELSLGQNTLTWNGKTNGSTLPEGMYSYQVFVADEEGNESERIEGSLVYDMTPPQISVVDSAVKGFSPNGDDVDDILQVSYHLSDNLFAGDIKVQLHIASFDDFELNHAEDTVSIPPDIHQISWNGTNAAANGVFDGNYTFNLIAEDPAGNRSTPTSGEAASLGQITVDRVAPETRFSITGPTFETEETTWMGLDATLRLVANDPFPASGVDHILYAFAEEPLQTYESPLVPPLEGIDYTLRYKAIDIIGNAEIEKTKKIQRDFTAPQSRISMGAPQLTEEEELFVSPVTEITLSAEDPEGVGVQDIYVQLSKVKDTATYHEPLTLNGLEDGPYTIVYWAKDLLNNTESKHFFNLTLDQTAPATDLIITGPSYRKEDILYVTSNTQIAFQATTNRNDLEGVKYKIGDNGWRAAEPISFEEEGEYLLSFESSDTLGNTEKTKVQKIVVDNTSPEMKLVLSQGDGSVYLTGNTRITLDVNDVSGVASLEYKIDDGTYQKYEGPFSLSGLEPGSHVVTYRATDSLGNISEEKKFVATLQNVRVTRANFVIPRTLVYLLQTFDLRPEDPRPNADFWTETLNTMGGYWKVVDTLDAFTDEMRSDKYTTFIFSTDSHVVNFSDSKEVVRMLKELKSRIHKGDAFISLADFADVRGDAWQEFKKGLEGGSFGEGHTLFKEDHFTEISADQKVALQQEWMALIDEMRPKGEILNAGEVIDTAVTFENRGNHDVVISVKEIFPAGGWIETEKTSGEVTIETRQFDLKISAKQKAVIDYLYRMPKAIGPQKLTVQVEERWDNKIQGEGSLDVTYDVQDDLMGLVKKMAVDSLERRLKLDPKAFATRESQGELIDIALQKFDTDFSTTKAKEVSSTNVDEAIENLQLARHIQALSANISLGENNADKPASFQGGTSAYLTGGCSLFAREMSLRENLSDRSNRAYFILLFLLFIPFLVWRLREYK